MLPLSMKTIWILRPSFSEQTVLIICEKDLDKDPPADKDHTFLAPRVVLIYMFYVPSCLLQCLDWNLHRVNLL